MRYHCIKTNSHELKMAQGTIEETIEGEVTALLREARSNMKRISNNRKRTKTDTKTDTTLAETIDGITYAFTALTMEYARGHQGNVYTDFREAGYAIALTFMREHLGLRGTAREAVNAVIDSCINQISRNLEDYPHHLQGPLHSILLRGEGESFRRTYGR